MNDFKFALLIIVLCVLLDTIGFWLSVEKIDRLTHALNDLLKSQKTLFYQAADHTVYTYRQVGQVCYEDVKEGKVVSSECH